MAAQRSRIRFAPRSGRGRLVPGEGGLGRSQDLALGGTVEQLVGFYLIAPVLPAAAATAAADMPSW